MLVLEPVGELALPSPEGVRLLGIEGVDRPRWPALRHVFELGADAGLFVEVGHDGDVVAFAVGYDIDSCDELLTPL
jgi:hypothetical protein